MADVKGIDAVLVSVYINYSKERYFIDNPQASIQFGYLLPLKEQHLAGRFSLPLMSLLVPACTV